MIWSCYFGKATEKERVRTNLSFENQKDIKLNENNLKTFINCLSGICLPLVVSTDYP